MASALRQVYSGLDPSTCTAYLLTRDGRYLTVAMTMDTPLSFAITPEISVDNMGFPTAAAHRKGVAVLRDPQGMRKLTEASPSLVTNMPFPLTVASAPIRTARRRFGAITVRCVPPRVVTDGELRELQVVADELAATLEDLAGKGVSVTSDRTPVFVSCDRGTADAGHGTPRGQRSEPGSGNRFLYQLQRLATELAGAVCVRDIVAITQTRVVRAFHGSTVALCLVEAERLHVVGAAGCSREQVHGIEGTLLSRRTPETDTIKGVKVRIFPTVEKLREEYPAHEIDHDRQAHAYFPLISHGKAVGCCVLGFDEAGVPLRADEIAVLMIMLEQIGQALARARAYEIEHAVTQSIQRSLLPRSVPHLSEVVTATRYFPAAQGAAVGGDWYDVIALAGGGIGFVVGDVEGHSLEAVSVMSQLRSAVRAYADEGHDPAAILARSNQLLVNLDTGLYATCCCLWLDVATGVVCMATAGHPLPLVTDHRSRLRRPRSPVGPPLGVEGQPRYEQGDMVLETGAVVAMYTDGLLNFRELGTERATAELSDLFVAGSRADLEVLADRMIDACRPSAGFADDAALLLLRYEGSRPRGHCRLAETSLTRHDLKGVSRTRLFLRRQLEGWDLPVPLDNLELLATEIVTNALIHAHSDVDLRLRGYPDRIRVEVRDGDPYPPVPTTPLDDATENQEAESGRGLLIVDALASAWGSSPAGRGKTTWFELRVPRPA
ncbi:SpoIIE family protein phosphatase [Streptomyces sp. NPDC026666]